MGAVEVGEQGPVTVLTLREPGRRNALSPEMRGELSLRLREATRANTCRAIVLTGADGHFCAGGDMRSSQIDNGPDPLRTLSNALPLQDIIRLIATGPKPVIVAVEGVAAGAGLSLVAACDIVVASQDATFHAAFPKVGLMPDTGILWSLPRRVGAAKANYLLISGVDLSAPEGLHLGLVDQMVPKGTALETAITLALSIADMAPLSVAATRGVIGRAAELESVLAAERQIQPLLTLTADYAEGRDGFRNRRKPRFLGK
jgi:enoyl-CoA hydratase/carnithine racemase